MTRSIIRCGFKGRGQLPLFMIWREYQNDKGDVYDAYVIFNSMNWIGF